MITIRDYEWVNSWRTLGFMQSGAAVGTPIPTLSKP